MYTILLIIKSLPAKTGFALLRNTHQNSNEFILFYLNILQLPIKSLYVKTYPSTCINFKTQSYLLAVILFQWNAEFNLLSFMLRAGNLITSSISLSLIASLCFPSDQYFIVISLMSWPAVLLKKEHNIM